MKSKYGLAISMVLFLIILSMNGISAAEASTNAAGTIADDRSAAIHVGHTHYQFSEKRKVVYVGSIDEILNYSLSDIENSIFVIDETPTRAYCCKFGRNSMSLRTWVENTKTRSAACPYYGARASDYMMRMDEYYGDYCTYCGKLNSANSGHYYLVECQSMPAGQSSTFRIIEGATESDGYDPHVCISVPSGF